MPCLFIVLCCAVLCSAAMFVCKIPSNPERGGVSPLTSLESLTVTRLKRVQRREARGVDGQSRPESLGHGLSKRI
jgi:hypothetical protein